MRIEHIRAGRRVVAGLTCVTPIDDTKTEVTHALYATAGWLRAAAPVAKLFVRRFLGQDRDVVAMQQDGLRYGQNLMLIRDADTQARWYQQLKNEFQRACFEGRPFNNPVTDVVLRWRS